MKHLITLAILQLASCIASSAPAAKPQTDQTARLPNILIIFTDDQGYADLACYGNKKNKTPRLDKLAEQGTRFTSFYSQTVCGPSRSALLTGRYPIRSKGWGMPADEITFDKLDLTNNTLVLYTSDNGPWNQDKYTRNKKGHPEGSIFWGEAGPLRNGKGSSYEAGYRLPCIARWTGKVPAGRTIDGIDQTDLLLGKTQKGRDDFYFNRAGIRYGKWKFLKAGFKDHGYAVEPDQPKVGQLFDLDADLGETTNLAKEHPEKLTELKKLFPTIDSSEKPLPKGIHAR